jgi:hypothetical protein
MLFTKNIIVVYPEIYEEIALTLQHELSKVDGVDSTAWTINHYKHTLPTLSGRSHIIFIGNAEENQYSKIYLSNKPNVVNLKGACFSCDGSKAVVFGEGKLEQKVAFEELKAKLGYGGASGTLGIIIGGSMLSTLPIVVAAAAGGLGYKAVRYYQDKNEAKALRYEQTKMATYNFVLTELDDWFGLEKKLP